MKKLPKNWQNTILIFSGIFLLGLFLRIYKLGSFPIFADEAIYVRWAQVMRAEPTLRFLPLSDGKQPLFMWAIIPFFKIFSDPLVAGRLVSVFAGLATLVGLFILSYLLFNSKKAALATGLLYAISPFFVFFDRMALVDSMLTMFGIWVFILSFLTAKYQRLDTALLAGFAIGGAWLTKSPAVFFVMLSATLVIFSKNKLKFLGLQGVSTAMGYGFYNILRLGPNFHLLNSRTQDYVYPISHLWEKPLDPFLPYTDRITRWISVLGPVFVLILGLIFISSSFKKHHKEIIFLTLWFVFPASVVAMFTKAITTRYILFAVPPFFILAGQAFEVEKYKKIIIGIFIINVIFALKFSYTLIYTPLLAELPPTDRAGYLVEWSSGIGIKEAADKLIEIRDANPGTNIVVGTEGHFGTLPDGLQIYLEKEPNITVVGVGQNISEVPSSLVESRRAGNLTFLVANSSRLNFSKEFSEYGLEVLYSVQKPDRSPDTHEYSRDGANDTFYLFEIK